MTFEQQYFDVLKSIELAIMTVGEQTPSAKDRHAEEALKGLVRYYNAAVQGKQPPTLKLGIEAKRFYDGVKNNMDAHMSANGLMGDERAYTVEEVVLCLKRIQRSVGQMIKRNPTGTAYLVFVRDYHNPNKAK